MAEALAAFRASGLVDADPSFLFGLASPGVGGASDSDSDYRNLLADEDDEAELLSVDGGGGDTSLNVHATIRQANQQSKNIQMQFISECFGIIETTSADTQHSKS